MMEMVELNFASASRAGILRQIFMSHMMSGVNILVRILHLVIRSYLEALALGGFPIQNLQHIGVRESALEDIFRLSPRPSARKPGVPLAPLVPMTAVRAEIVGPSQISGR